jgi:hypothetical protein
MSLVKEKWVLKRRDERNDGERKQGKGARTQGSVFSKAIPLEAWTDP